MAVQKNVVLNFTDKAHFIDLTDSKNKSYKTLCEQVIVGFDGMASSKIRMLALRAEEDDLKVVPYSAEQHDQNMCPACAAKTAKQGKFAWVIDLGDGHTGEFVCTDKFDKRKVRDDLIQDGKLITGIVFRHDLKTGAEPCKLFVEFETGVNNDSYYGRDRGFNVTQLAPLTIHPSVNCVNCPAHAWVRAGRWDEIARDGIRQAQRRWAAKLVQQELAPIIEAERKEAFKATEAALAEKKAQLAAKFEAAKRKKEQANV